MKKCKRCGLGIKVIPCPYCAHISFEDVDTSKESGFFKRQMDMKVFDKF